MASITDAELVDRLPGILVDGDNKDYYRGWLERRLVLNRARTAVGGTTRPSPSAPSAGRTGSGRPR